MSQALQIVSVLVLLCLGRVATAQAWLAAANQRIEQHRKADLTVKVVDRQGQPVPDATVHVEMKRHSFGFGTAVPASRINDTSSNGNMFRAKLLENFNHVVFENDLKWPPWVGLWGSGFNWASTTNAMDWLNANRLPIRGHYLSWATWSGSDAWGTSHSNPPQSVIDSLPQRLLDHITDKATRVGNRVVEWDVINHPVGWLNDTYENRITSGLDFYVDIVNHSRSVVPEGVTLWINEDDIIAGDSRANDYERIIRYMLDQGAPLDGVGFQGHFIQEWGRVTNSSPQQVYNRIERFAQFDLPLRITEFDIDVGTNEVWQGQLMHDYLTVMFSHPAMEAITMWGFWQGSHWRPNAALFRTDWSEKPALLAYRDLVFNQWWSDESGVSDELGEHQLRAFKGEYDITVTLDGEDYVLSGVSLDDDMTILMTLPISLALPGDFNGDGTVNAADYTLWRDGFGTAFTEEDYALWKNNFSATAASGAARGSSSQAALPEPTSLLMLGFGAAIQIRCWCGRCLCGPTLARSNGDY